MNILTKARHSVFQHCGTLFKNHEISTKEKRNYKGLGRDKKEITTALVFRYPHHELFGLEFVKVNVSDIDKLPGRATTVPHLLISLLRAILDFC